MIAPSVTVVDYGIGNIRSVSRALTFCGANVELTDDPRRVMAAERLVLPGVGAFAKCVEALASHGLSAATREFFASDRPFLGICVGMQMMFESSEEFGVSAGLNLIEGRVRAIPSPALGTTPYKIPHIGWSALRRPANTTWKGTILEDCEDNEPVYFVHSYTAEPSSESTRLADCDYYGNRVSAVVRNSARYGCQFHPEKSGPAGLAILRQFLSLTANP